MLLKMTVVWIVLIVGFLVLAFGIPWGLSQADTLTNLFTILLGPIGIGLWGLGFYKAMMWVLWQ